MRIMVTLSVLLTIVVNGLANALPINGQTTGDISNRFEVLFTPANYVFAIWGVIYIGLICIAVYQALPSQKANPRLEKVRGWMVVSGVANIAWILLWHYEQFPLTMVAMGLLLLTLIITYRRLEIGRLGPSLTERWMLQVPIGIYLGWISVATVANASVVLVVQNWGGWGISPQIWTLIMMGVALILGWVIAWQRSETAFPLVLAWAFAGIAIRNAGTEILVGGAWVAVGLALLASLISLRKAIHLRQHAASSALG